MNDLQTLQTLFEKLDKEYIETVKDLPIKRKRDAVEAAIAAFTETAAIQNPKSTDIRPYAGKPRTLATEEQKKEIMAIADNYYATNSNKGLAVRELTDMVIKSGINLPADKVIHVVGGVITKNPKYQGKNGLWNIKEFAA